MTYRQISYLRRRLGLGVEELLRKFPQHRREISVTEWSFRGERKLRQLSKQNRRLYQEVIACRQSLLNDE